MKKILLGAASVASLSLSVNLANAIGCNWVGGTGTFSLTNTANWASGSGGGGGTCGAVGGVPKNSGDVATFDSLSGGGAVTLDSSLTNLNIAEIVATSYTGTLDGTVNNPTNITFNTTATGFSIGSTGIAKLGSGTYNFNGSFSNTSSSAQSFASSTLAFSSTGNSGTQTLTGGSATFGTITINGRTTGQGFNFSGANTTGTMNLNGQLVLNFANNQAITNFNVSGSASQYAMFGVITNSGTTITLTVTSANINRGILRGVTFAGASVTANNSIDLGDNNMNGGSINPPSGGGGYIIGGN